MLQKLELLEDWELINGLGKMTENGDLGKAVLGHKDVGDFEKAITAESWWEYT